MKKGLLKIFAFGALALSPLCLLGTIKGGNFLHAEGEAPTYVDSLGDIDKTGDYVLAEDITLSGTHTPISKFTGTFDGDGKSITLGNGTTGTFGDKEYQGLFGHVQGTADGPAVIKNLKVKVHNWNFDFSFNSSVDEYIAGVLVGKGSNVIIENCEIEGSLLVNSNDIELKTTFGGIAGQLDSASVIKNCGAYLDVEFTTDLTNEYTVRMGGLVGSLEDSSEMTYCVGYNDFKISNVSDVVPLELVEGGLVGNINDGGTKIYNSSSQTTFTNDLQMSGEDVDTAYIGGVAGTITNTKPTSGNIASVGYYYSVNGESGSDFYGNSSDIIYNHLNGNDSVIEIPNGIMSAKDYFTTDDYNECGMEWYDYLTYWDFDTTWIIANGEARLQQFQVFKIEFATNLDSTNGTLEYLSGDSREYAYDEGAILSFTFKEDETKEGAEYRGYYKINDILCDGESIGFSPFEVPSGAVVNGNEISWTASNGTYKIVVNDTASPATTTKTWTSISGNHILTEIDKGEETTFTLTVSADESTKGTYSFRTTKISYYGYVIAGEGGFVSSSTAANAAKYKALDPRELTKGGTMTIQAIPAYQHVFTNWTFWEETTLADYEANASTKSSEYYKHTYKDKITGATSETYWKLIPMAEITNEMLESLSSANYNLEFGTYRFTKNFLLKANYEESTYQFNIVNIDIEKINKVEVVYNTDQVYTFDENSTNRDYVTLDQNEYITMNVYLKEGYVMNDEESFPEAMRVNLIDKEDYEYEGGTGKMFSYAIGVSSLASLVNLSEQYGLEIALLESEEGVNNGLPLWVILVIAGGSALIVTVLIIVIVKFARRRGGKTPKTNKKEEKIDYSQMYR